MADTRVIDGKAHADRLRALVAESASNLREKHHYVPTLAVILVGDDAASQLYVRNKSKALKDAGLNSSEHRLPAATGEAELLALVGQLNADPEIDGILVQFPLPHQIDQRQIIEAIDPSKDVDGLHPFNVGRLWNGGLGLVPCTPMGCLIMLRHTMGELTGGDLSGANAVVLGRSGLTGKPTAALLLNENCTVTIAHSKSRDLPALVKTADILVAAVGQAQMVKGSWLKPGVVVIDIGINRVPGADGKSKLVGDVAYQEAFGIAAAITPVPGGVGLMTIACLLRNTLVAGCLRHGFPVPTF